MILSTLKNSRQIESVHPLLKELFDYVASHDLLHAPLGRITIDGDRLFINNVLLDGASRNERPLEVHRHYIDVHILLEGKETIGWKALENMRHFTKEYVEADDCALSDETPTCFIDLLPGQFLFVAPEDAHAPAIGEGKIRKLIAKVKVE
jgi:YhcH/YjgK/YiaL family protein